MANVAVLITWTIGVLRVVKPHGVVFMDRPSPLDAGDIRHAFEQVRANPAYQHQTIHSLTHDGRWVIMRDGVIEEAP